MKKLILLLIGVSIIEISAAQKKDYDLTTPQKMIASMNLIGEGIPDYDAIPVFYNRNEATAIKAFDDAIIEGRSVFAKFCTNLSTQFPKNVVAFDRTEIEIKPDASLSKTISFSFTSTGIIEQLVKFKAGSVAFISETATDKGIEVKAKVNGKEKKFTVIKKGDVYVIILPQTEIDKLNKATELIKTSVEKINLFNSKIEKGELNNLNFNEVITKWYQDFVN